MYGGMTIVRDLSTYPLEFKNRIRLTHSDFIKHFLSILVRKFLGKILLSMMLWYLLKDCPLHYGILQMVILLQT